MPKFITRYLYTTSTDPDNAAIYDHVDEAAEAAIEWLRGVFEPNDQLEAVVRQKIERDVINDSDGFTAQFPNSIEYIAIRAINLPSMA